MSQTASATRQDRNTAIGLERKTVVITGASAGLCRAAAIEFARKGHDVALIARSRQGLEDTAEDLRNAGSGEPLVLPCDVASYKEVQDAAAKIIRAFGKIDVWVNGAMVTVFSPIEKMRPEEYRRVTEVTYLGTVHGTMAALEHMKEAGRGHIIQVGSALAYRSIPLQSAYCAAKFAVRGFTDSLRTELIHENSGIDVTMIQIPAFNTPQFQWARRHLDEQPRPVGKIYSPEIAGRAIVWVSEHPKRELWLGLPTWTAIIGQLFFPGLLDRLAARKSWEGQFAATQKPKPDHDNLFETPTGGFHKTHGPFTKEEQKKSSEFLLVKYFPQITGIVLLLFFAALLLLSFL